MSCGAFEREIGFSKTRALRKRERERQTDDVVSDLPLKGKKRERRPTLDLHPIRKEVQKRGKKKRIDSQNITYRRKKEKELKRERERECFFKRKERHFSSFLSLLSLDFPGGRSELKSRQTFFVSPRDTDLISLSLFYYFTRR